MSGTRPGGAGWREGRGHLRSVVARGPGMGAKKGRVQIKSFVEIYNHAFIHLRSCIFCGRVSAHLCSRCMWRFVSFHLRTRFSEHIRVRY